MVPNLAYLCKMNSDQAREHLKSATYEGLGQYVATQLRRARRQKKESQAKFAARAGIALRTYKRLETHGLGQMDTFLKALAALDRSQYLFLLFPQDVGAQRNFTLGQKIESLRQRALGEVTKKD